MQIVKCFGGGGEREGEKRRRVFLRRGVCNYGSEEGVTRGGRRRVGGTRGVWEGGEEGEVATTSVRLWRGTGSVSGGLEQIREKSKAPHGPPAKHNTGL